MKKRKKFFVPMLMTCILLCSIVSYASIAYGSWSYKTVFGRSYKYRSYAGTNSSGATAITSIHSNDGSSFPTGYGGARARLYKPTAVIVASSNWVYNSSPATSVAAATPNHSGATTYYSCGEVAMYDGNGYKTDVTTMSPYVQYSSSNSSGNIPINMNVAQQIEDMFGMIPAVGKNGKTGFVTKKDLDGDLPSCPEEVEEYMRNLKPEREIPLYDVDGVTVIDTFVIRTVIPE